MSYSEALTKITLPAHADYSAKQYRAVSINTSGRAELTGAGAEAAGVLQNKPDAQDVAATVAINGVTKMHAGESISKGDKIASDADGDAVTAGTGDNIIGQAIESASSGELFAMLIKIQNVNSIS